MISQAMQPKDKDAVDRVPVSRGRASSQGGGWRRSLPGGAGLDPLGIQESHEEDEISPDLRSPDRRSHKAQAHGSVDSHGRSSQPRGSTAWVDDCDDNGGREGEHCHLTHDHHHRVAEVLDAEFLHGDGFKTPLSPAQERRSLTMLLARLLTTTDAAYYAVGGALRPMRLLWPHLY